MKKIVVWFESIVQWVIADVKKLTTATTAAATAATPAAAAMTATVMAAAAIMATSVCTEQRNDHN